MHAQPSQGSNRLCENNSLLMLRNRREFSIHRHLTDISPTPHRYVTDTSLPFHRHYTDSRVGRASTDGIDRHCRPGLYRLSADTIGRCLADSRPSVGSQCGGRQSAVGAYNGRDPTKDSTQ